MVVQLLCPPVQSDIRPGPLGSFGTPNLHPNPLYRKFTNVTLLPLCVWTVYLNRIPYLRVFESTDPRDDLKVCPHSRLGHNLKGFMRDSKTLNERGW